MKFPGIRFYMWLMVFVGGVIVGATVIPNFYTRLPDSATATTIPFTIQSVSETNGSAVVGTTQSTFVLPVGFEQRLHAHVDSVLQAAVANALERQTPAVSVTPAATGKSVANISLTDNQVQAFEGLRARLQDAVKNHNMTLGQLASAPEMTQLPPAWRIKILNQAAEMLTRGELVPAQFIDTQR